MRSITCYLIFGFRKKKKNVDFNKYSILGSFRLAAGKGIGVINRVIRQRKVSLKGKGKEFSRDPSAMEGQSKRKKME